MPLQAPSHYALTVPILLLYNDIMIYLKTTLLRCKHPKPYKSAVLLSENVPGKGSEDDEGIRLLTSLDPEPGTHKPYA